MVAPRVLAFAKRLDRPPQASLQLFTTHVCALVEVLAQSCREDSLAALHALMPLISWLAVYKETLSHGEEYLLCLP